MSKKMKTLVMKFGGAAMATPAHFNRIAQIVIEKNIEFPRIVIVVSAMGKTTDHLIELSKQIHSSPPQREYDMLISAGERISISLLAMALCRQKKDAISFTGSQSGIMTCSNHSNAQILDIRPYRISNCLDQGKIVIVAGFQGVSCEKEITTLGRGGSDTSAVALGAALKAEYIEFYKDVKGIFNDDPKKNSQAIQYEQLTYQEALDTVSNGARILHPRAISLAAKNGLPLHVRSFISSDKDFKGTWVFDSEIKRQPLPVYEVRINN